MPNGILDGLVRAFHAALAFIDIVPILPCSQQDNLGLICVRTLDASKNDAPVAVARVTITATDGSTLQDFTDGTGSTVYHAVPAGTYRVEAWHFWHLPEVASADVQVGVGQIASPVLDLEELRFYLHVDADRDGGADDARSSGAPWGWGTDGRGAILLCNQDDDGNPGGAPDHADTAVNGGNDNVEVAPLQVRRVGSATEPPDTWRMELCVPENRQAYVRIFAGRGQGSAEIIGPTTSASRVVSARNFATTTYGIEATRYPGRYGDDEAEDFDGLIEVTLTVGKVRRVGDNPRLGNPKYTSKAVFRVAPWLMPHHGHPANTVYIAENDDNEDVRVALLPFLDDDEADCTLVTHAIDTEDYWMQDCMEIGFSNSPAARIDTVIKATRGMELATFPATLLGADYGYLEPGTAGARGTDYDGLGNLEVTPPCRDSDGKVFPLGRIYYGLGTDQNPFDPRTRAFLEAQQVQEPVRLDSHWLRVGHVDEFMSFVPWADGEEHKKWKLLVASPRRAYQILDAITDKAHATILRGAQLSILTGLGTQNHNLAMTVQAFLNTAQLLADAESVWGAPLQWISSAQLRAWNENRVQARIERIFPILEDAIDLDRDEDVIHIPVIFYPENVDWNRVGAGAWDIGDSCAGALTGDMVNMLVVNGHCIVPQARGARPVFRPDAFEAAVRTDLEALGLTVHFIDCWEPYHVRHGEIHCGTNTLRKPEDLAGWLGTATARWWEFEP